MRIRVRDLLATGLVVALVVPYLAFLMTEDLPLIEDTRDMTAVALMLGGAIIGLLLSVERYDGAGWFILGVAVVSVVLGATALALPGTAAAGILLAAFVATVLTVWAIEFTEHITFSTPPRH